MRTFTALVLVATSSLPIMAAALGGGTPEEPMTVPKLWDDAELQAMTLPSAKPGTRILYLSEEQYYKIPEEPAWKSYPVSAPGRERKGNLDLLKTLKPQEVFDLAKPRTTKEWIAAGEVLFDTPFDFTPLEDSPISDPQWWAAVRPPVSQDGSIPGYRYVIRKPGIIEVGSGACASCHSRVMDDGIVIKGAQGNFPFGAAEAYRIRRKFPLDKPLPAKDWRFAPAFVFPDDPNEQVSYGLYQWTAREIADAYQSLIPGLAARPGFTMWDMPKTADLIGVKNRRYLDMTARLENRKVSDIMRYAAGCGGGNYFFSSENTLPAKAVPPPSESSRASDAVFYAIAQYVYALTPPPNPNLPKTAEEQRLVDSGAEVFDREDCARCHKPPFYTNNKLTPAGNFKIPQAHRDRYNVAESNVGTNPQSATKSDRGRGYYKVPSLLGVWYRGPFEHNGSIAKLEDWFDARRLQTNYVPTGFIGYKVIQRAVEGHRFGLDLTPEEKKALIAFLRTL